MVKHSLYLFAIGAFATLSAASSASAGCCPGAVSPCGCAPVVAQQVVVAPPVEMYVVNQGPVYSGPGSYVTQRNFIEGDQTAPYGYPYVSFVPADTYAGGYRDFFSGYRPARATHAKPVRVHRAKHYD